MGILDDAIREHLELKRKHGVPEEEVERQEEEALGPARREVAQQPEDAEIAADAGDDTSLFDGKQRGAPVAEAPAVADDETVIAGPPPAEPRSEVAQPPTPSAVDASPAELAEPPVESAPPAELAESTSPDPFAEEEPPATEPPVADHTGLEPPPPEPDPHEALGDTEPHGFPALEDDDPDEDDVLEDDPNEEPLPASDAEEDDELDVLEDTPDFLQETPEHDRLWFEQKPPRDFDFD